MDPSLGAKPLAAAALEDGALALESLESADLPGEPATDREAQVEAATPGDLSAAEVAAAIAEEAAAQSNAVEPPAQGGLDENVSVPELPEEATLEQLARVASALIFASDRPLTAARLAELLGQPSGKVRSALAQMAEKLASIDAPFALVEIAGGYRFLTDPAMARFVAGLRGEQKKERLSAAALETLAIIAYRQPVTKGEIEAMRGVQAGPILRQLLDRRLVKVTGRAAVPGRPLQYGTTKEFLDRFNLGSLKDLPTIEELTRP
ncbi:MAG: SMC-Scp complex subunit ScpB [Planctomycetes bacterium]|nr:SMC-Scp complex subunit ScpB [Planctomycetota bacterium]